MTDLHALKKNMAASLCRDLPHEDAWKIILAIFGEPPARIEIIDDMSLFLYEDDAWENLPRHPGRPRRKFRDSARLLVRLPEGLVIRAWRSMLVTRQFPFQERFRIDDALQAIGTDTVREAALLCAALRIACPRRELPRLTETLILEQEVYAPSRYQIRPFLETFMYREDRRITWESAAKPFPHQLDSRVLPP